MKTTIMRNVKCWKTCTICDINYQNVLAPDFLLNCCFVLFEKIDGDFVHVTFSRKKDGERELLIYNIRKYVKKRIRKSLIIKKDKIFILENSKVVSVIRNRKKDIYDFLKNNKYSYVKKHWSKQYLLNFLKPLYVKGNSWTVFE